MRAEILQDVQRLPDEPFYHEPRTQTMILDVLFIYCKLNPDVGGYRQGMHELLAPLVYVVEQDAINKAEASGDGAADLTMIEMLDAAFVEHDAFALFSRLMDHAKAFYETGDGAPGGQSSIVEKSQYIHEGLLGSVDPDLSTHLTNVEILPQIFLMYVFVTRPETAQFPDSKPAAGFDSCSVVNSPLTRCSCFGIPFSASTRPCSS